jgi:hypothetical protein
VLLSDFRVVAAGRDYMISIDPKGGVKRDCPADEVVDADFTSSKASCYALPPNGGESRGD